MISVDLCFRRACIGEETSLKLYFHEMQLQVIWSTEENQVFASDENMVFIQVVVIPHMEVSISYLDSCVILLKLLFESNRIILLRSCVHSVTK